MQENQDYFDHLQGNGLKKVNAVVFNANAENANVLTNKLNSNAPFLKAHPTKIISKVLVRVKKFSSLVFRSGILISKTLISYSSKLTVKTSFLRTKISKFKNSTLKDKKNPI